MNLTIGVTTNRVGQYKQAVTNKQTAQKHSYANNVFSEFSKEASSSVKSAVIGTTIYSGDIKSPSFKGSTTA